MAICPYLSKMIMTSMSYSGTATSNTVGIANGGGGYGYWALEEGTPTNEIKWAICNEDGTVTLNGETQDCELWDSVNNRCGTKVSDTIRNNTENETPTLITLLENVLGKVSERDASNTVSTLVEVLNHIHSSHYHVYVHECESVPSECGQGSLVPPLSNILISEYNGKEDLDNNGLIYGVDFKINDDGDKPNVLKSIENSTYWIEPSSTMSWSEYVEQQKGEE